MGVGRVEGEKGTGKLKAGAGWENIVAVVTRQRREPTKLC